MNSLTLASPSLVESRWVQFFKSAHQGSRALSISAWAMVLAFAICSVLQWLDPREFNGINLWVKPGKFYISMALHFFTVAWALSLVDVKHRASRVTLWMIAALVFCAWAEHAYITYRAAMGEASHRGHTFKCRALFNHGNIRNFFGDRSGSDRSHSMAQGTWKPLGI
jgi:hypothetical protein